MSDSGPEVMATIFAYPRDNIERRTRIYYGLVFLCSKTLALSLAFVPGELADLLFGLSVANFLFTFLLDACARRESKRFAGESGVETEFSHCLLETILGSWMAHKLLDKCSEVKERVFSGKQRGSIFLSEASEDTQIEEAAAVVPPKASNEQISLEEWSRDISWAYNSAMLLKKALGAAVVILRFLYDRWNQPPRLDIAARVISSFTSLVLVDLIDGLAKEESRLRSRPARTGVLNKIFGWFG